MFRVDGFTTKNDLDVKSAPLETKTTTSEAERNYPAIADLSLGESEYTYVNLRVWAEGIDKDTTNSALSGQFRLALDLDCLEDID